MRDRRSASRERGHASARVHDRWVLGMSLPVPLPCSVTLSRIRRAAKNLGEFDLVGEIVDSKCYLGNMNPGNGKVRRDCAVRCLSGDIPLIFSTNDFNRSPAVLLLTGPHQMRLPREAFLDRVAEPMRINGRIVQIGNTLLRETESSAIASRSFRGRPEQGR